MSDEPTDDGSGSGTTVPVTIDADVWIRVQDDDAAESCCYKRGRVTAIAEDNAKVTGDGDGVWDDADGASGDVFLRDAVTQEDMVKLNHLHEAGVLDNLERRYSTDEIYTYTGSILIAVNPFKDMSHLYDAHMMSMYRGARQGDLNPHCVRGGGCGVRSVAKRRRFAEHLGEWGVWCGENGNGKVVDAVHCAHVEWGFV
jgi:myosin heavy subunit